MDGLGCTAAISGAIVEPEMGAAVWGIEALVTSVVILVATSGFVCAERRTTTRFPLRDPKLASDLVTPLIEIVPDGTL